MEKIISLKELRQKMPDYTQLVRRGQSFIVVKQSKPIFKVVPLFEKARQEEWEEVVDFTKIKKGGVKIEEVLSRL